jgi:FlaG/FlaF family flagellin (archaellin)
VVVKVPVKVKDHADAMVPVTGTAGMVDITTAVANTINSIAATRPGRNRSQYWKNI